MATAPRSDAGARTPGGWATRPLAPLLSVLLAGALLGAGPPQAARAATPLRAVTPLRSGTPVRTGGHVGVDTNPSGAHVELGRDRSWVEVVPPGGNGRGRGTGATGCRRRWVPASKPVLIVTRPVPIYIGFLPAPSSPDAKPYFVYCDSTYVTTIWATPSQFNGGNPAVAARALAERLVRDLPFPQVGIGISPAARGLTGLESWYWVTGYDGTPVTASVAGFGTTVTVEARPTRIDWDFGDHAGPGGGDVRPGGGQGRADGLGTPYPARSSVTHTYERRSGPGGFTVQVHFALATRFRVDAGPWQALDPVERAARRAYPVDESRAQLQATAP